MRRLFIHIVLTLAVVLMASAATAQSSLTVFDPRVVFSGETSPGMRLEGYLERVRGYHRRADVNSDGVVSNADLEQYRSDAAALARSRAIGELLRYDLDGDGVVTRAEVVEAETRRVRSETRENPKLAKDELSILQRIDRAADLMMRADLNKDGHIDWPEMLEFAKHAPIYSIPPYQPTYRMIMTFDEDGDGAVTIEEFDRAAERVFHLMDVNKDGTLSKNEIDAFRREIHQAVAPNDAMIQAEARMRERQAKTMQACAMPQASAGATILLLDAHGADALSTATIGPQWIATEAGSIDIEPGTGPLYIVIASYNPVIWQLSGAVDRVERLVLAGESTGPNQSLPEETPLIGATGVPPERIVFLGQPGCMTFHASPSVTQSQAAAEAVRRETGRNPVILKLRTRDAVALPPEIVRFHPEGIVEIEPRTVVASHAVARYDVMPEEAGLIQLQQEGAIIRNNLGEFLVRKKIRFPAGLYGAHLVRFRIQKDTPMPEGDPGHSCVIVEDTGMMLYNGATCHGPFGLNR